MSNTPLRAVARTLAVAFLTLSAIRAGMQVRDDLHAAARAAVDDALGSLGHGDLDAEELARDTLQRVSRGDFRQSPLRAMQDALADIDTSALGARLQQAAQNVSRAMVEQERRMREAREQVVQKAAADRKGDA